VPEAELHVCPSGCPYSSVQTAVDAARDAGVDSDVTIDIDGQIRPMGLGWDLGADSLFLRGDDEI